MQALVKTWPVALVLAAVLIAMGFVTTRQAAETTSGTWDETIYLALGRSLAAGDRGALADLGVAPLPVALAWSRRVVEPVSAPPGDSSVYRDRISRARARAVQWFAIPCFVGVFVIIGMARGIWVGFFAALLVALSPNVIAHASLATTDMAFATVSLACVAAMIGYFRNPSPVWTTGLAIALGVSLSVKYSAVLLVAATLVLFAMQFERGRWRRDVTVLAMAVLIAWALHGFATVSIVSAGGIPLPIFFRGVAVQADLDAAGQEAFLLGSTSQRGWWYYFPVALALKSTPIELIGFVAFAWVALRRLRSIEHRVAATVVAIFVGASLFTHRDLGVRYLLPVTVLCLAGAAVWVSDLIKDRRRLALMAVAAIAGQSASHASIAPHYLAYFNGFSGGAATGYRKLVDSNLDWGQDLPSLAEWLTARGDTRVALAYYGSAPTAAYGINAVALRSAAEPAAARPRYIAISATLLQGVFACGDPLRAFRALPEDGRAGYSIFIYALERPEVLAALSTVVTDPCLP